MNLTIYSHITNKAYANFLTNANHSWFGERYFVAEKAFEDAINANYPCFCVFDESHNIHGICSYCLYLVEENKYNFYYISHIATSGIYKGIGKLLMREVFNVAFSSWKDVRLHSSEGSIGFYEHIGMTNLSPSEEANEFYVKCTNLIALIDKLNRELPIEDNTFVGNHVYSLESI